MCRNICILFFYLKLWRKFFIYIHKPGWLKHEDKHDFKTFLWLRQTKKSFDKRSKLSPLELRGRDGTEWKVKFINFLAIWCRLSGVTELSFEKLIKLKENFLVRKQIFCHSEACDGLWTFVSAICLLNIHDNERKNFIHFQHRLFAYYFLNFSSRFRSRRIKTAKANCLINVFASLAVLLAIFSD